MNRKAERGHATRSRLVSLAVRLFAEHGYEATSVDMVLRESGMSRGALYHHFAGKEALFAGALEAVEVQIAESVAAAARQLDDPRAALRAGCLAWVRMAREPVVRQIVLVDAPSVVGWHRWREIEERYGFGLLKSSLQRVARHGGLPPELVDSFAHMLLAAMNEIALVTANANAADGDEAIRQGENAVDELLRRLLAG